MVASQPHADGRAARVLVSIAVVAVVAIDALYLAIIRSQGDQPSDTPWITPFVAGFLVLIVAMLVTSLTTPGAVTAGLRGAAAGGLLLLAVLSAFSIGLAVLVAALVCIAATVVTVAGRPGARAVLSATAGFLLTIALLLVGLQIAWQQITCPASGESGGTTASLIGAGATYECKNGHLTYTSR